MRIFADDTCLMVQSPKLNNLQYLLNFEIASLYNWCNVNKLTVNTTKCNVLVVPPQLQTSSPEIPVQIASSSLNATSSVKYLGILIDSKLTFTEHLKKVENKLARATGILSKLQTTLPPKSSLKLYYTLFHPHLLYGLIVWGSTYPSFLNKLGKLQNKAVKLVARGKFCDKATPYSAKLKILKIYIN